MQSFTTGAPARDTTASPSRSTSSPGADIASLPDEALIERIDSLSRMERLNTLDILLHLIEVERRQLWRGLEYRSMFDYCVRRLRYSEGAAGRRIRTARLIATYPYVYDRIRAGRLSLCAVSKIARAVLDHGRRDFIDRIEGKRLDQIDAILAVHRNPSRPVRESIRLLCVERPLGEDERAARPQQPHPEGAGAGAPVDADGSLAAGTPGDLLGGNRAADAGAGISPGGGSVPSGPDAGAGGHDAPGVAGSGSGERGSHGRNDGGQRTAVERVYRFQFGIDARTMAKFARVQSTAAIRAGGHVDLSALFEVLCDTYLDRYDAATRATRQRKKAGVSGASTRLVASAAEVANTDEVTDAAPAAGGGPTRGRHPRTPPRAVRDEVIRRDGGRCTYVNRRGERCAETIALQVDHMKPAALGGSNDPSNLRAMCPAHNRLLAERTFGRKTVARAIESARGREPD